MFERSQENDSLRRRSKLFRIVITTTALLIVAVTVVLSIVYVRDLLGISFSLLLTVANLVFGYVAYKKGYVKQPKEGSAKSYFKMFIVKEKRIVAGGLLCGLPIMSVLTALYGPVPYSQSLVLFLILFAIGAITTYLVGRKLRWY
jgi:pilus assembly protein TadC